MEENGRCSTDHTIQWIIIRNVILYEEHVRINLFSNTNYNKNLASTLLSRILYFVVCLHWFSKQRHHSHPFVQQQLLQSCYPSSNLIGRPVFSLCETEKIRRTGQKKHLHFRCANVRGLCGSIHRKLLFYSSASSRLKFIALFRAQCGKAFSPTLINFILFPTK